MKYEKPEIELLRFETDDMVRTSENDWDTPQQPW